MKVEFYKVCRINALLLQNFSRDRKPHPVYDHADLAAVVDIGTGMLLGGKMLNAGPEKPQALWNALGGHQNVKVHRTRPEAIIELLGRFSQEIIPSLELFESIEMPSDLAFTGTVRLGHARPLWRGPGMDR